MFEGYAICWTTFLSRIIFNPKYHCLFSFLATNVVFSVHVFLVRSVDTSCDISMTAECAMLDSTEKQLLSKMNEEIR